MLVLYGLIELLDNHRGVTAGVFGLLYLAVGIAVCVLLLVEDDGRPIDDTSDSDLALCGKV